MGGLVLAIVKSTVTSRVNICINLKSNLHILYSWIGLAYYCMT